MPMLTKKKRHLFFGHGFFSSSPPVISSPKNLDKISGMDRPLPTTGYGDYDSAADDMQATRAPEPLVEDLNQVHADEDHAPVQLFQPSLARAADYSPGRHPSRSPSEEDAAAAPPDFTRRGIHIPTRTR
jgi:hypothetical protein